MKHQLLRQLLAVILLAVLPLPLIIILDRGLLATPGQLAAYDLGIFAYVSWLALLYLSTRPKWVEHLLGLPTTYFFHGILGIIALAAATIHRFTAQSYHWQIVWTGLTAWLLEIVLAVFAIVFLSGWLADRSKAWRKLRESVPHQLSLWGAPFNHRGYRLNLCSRDVDSAVGPGAGLFDRF